MKKPLVNLNSLAALTAFSGLLGLTMFCNTAQALGRLADVTVTDRNTGSTLPVHFYNGEYWVAGVPGAKYAIDIWNKTGKRILAVTSVDGLNVLTGKTANPNQTGYVLNGSDRYGVTGWRKSDSSVAAFQFTASPNSYAERTGRPLDVGVIGVALFRERQEPVVKKYEYKYDQEQGSRSLGDQAAPEAAATPKAAPIPEPAAASKAAPMARAESSDANQSSTKESLSRSDKPSFQAAPKLGTGHGERETSIVSQTNFERERYNPNEVIRIRYDSRENLIAMGVIREFQPHGSQPNPFPGSSHSYVPDPPRYR
jgi:hypothetical protein